jgi:transcriptional regulator with XRE-family HTH domain
MAKMTAAGLTPIGDVVRAWREFRGFSSTKLADKAGVRLSYLSEIEHNKTASPREEYLEKVALVLEVPLEDIYGRRLPSADGQAGGASSSKRGEGDEGSQKGAAPSTVLRAPLAIKRQKILLHRLGVAEKKLQAAGTLLSELYQEFREIAALVAETPSEEQDNAPKPTNGGV